MEDPLPQSRAEILYRVARDVLHATTSDEIIACALREIDPLLPGWVGAISLIDGRRNTFTLHVVGSAPRSEALDHLDGNLRTLARGTSETAQDVAAWAEGPTVALRLLLPLRDAGTLIGVLHLGQPHALDDTEASCRAEELASLLGAALTRERIREELAQAGEQARSARDAMGGFLAHMSHEFRLPLNAIIGYVELIQEERTTMSPEGLGEDLGRVHASAQHLLALVNQVLDHAGIVGSADDADVTLTPVDLYTLLAELDQVVVPLVSEKGNQWSVSCPADLFVTGDPLRLRQVLLNLVGNAARFTEGGQIAIEVGRDDRWVSIVVRDTGLGIHEERLSTLFEPFTQAHQDRERFGGTGLGLAICRGYVEMMGGAIEVDSELGVGTSVRVRLLAG